MYECKHTIIPLNGFKFRTDKVITFMGNWKVVDLQGYTRKVTFINRPFLKCRVLGKISGGVIEELKK